MFNRICRLIEPLRSQKWRDAQEKKAFDAVFEKKPTFGEKLLGLITTEWKWLIGISIALLALFLKR